MLDNAAHTSIEALGEFGLIKHLTDGIEICQKSTLKGVGDDAAVIETGDDCMLVTTDMLIEGVHFDLHYVPLKHLGYKAVAVNLSDICAMNGVPTQITVGIALSSKYTLDAVEELYAGMRLACEKYNVDLVGGDTCSSKIGMCISITALGRAAKDKIAYRSGAQNNDLICVSGDLGAAYMGLQVLEREKAVFKENPKIQPDLEGFDYILECQLKPEPRVDIVRILEESGVKPTSMIDISDGLASEILHICKASNKGCQLFEEKIPIDHLTAQTAETFSTIPITAALHGGEDYELLFTIPLSEYEKIQNKKEISVIGHITEHANAYYLVGKGGQVAEIKAQGFTAF